jgi:nucleoside-diphosphate-sugar epimerase
LHESAEGQDPGISHVFADFVHRIVREQQNPMIVIGSGEQIRCFTWIEDVAEAIARYSFDASTRNLDFNLGNPEPVTMLDLAQRIYRQYHEVRGIPPARPLSFVHQPSFRDDVQVRIPSIEKAKHILSWEPKVHLDEMLRRCVQDALEPIETPA